MGDCVNCAGPIDSGSGWTPQVVGALIVGYVCEDCEGEV